MTRRNIIVVGTSAAGVEALCPAPEVRGPEKRNKGEEELKKRLEESVVTAERDLKLLREILERI